MSKPLLATIFAFTLLAACGGEEAPAAPDVVDGGTDGGAGCANPCGTNCCAATQVCDAQTKTCHGRCTAKCDGRACGPDGCGGSCGSCGAGFVCSESQGVCEPCTPSCSGKACGPDGCGGQCGACGRGTFCDGAQCVTCTPKTCAQLGKTCGQHPDGCGGTVECGGCPSPETCGGGGTPGVCGCTKVSCLSLGKNCGALSDGCGGTLNCGTCGPGESCGGGGVPNVCGAGTCSPKGCAEQGKNCGVINDGCGSTVACGTCSAPNTCGGGGVANVCGCTQQTDAELCAAAGRNCGPLSVTDRCLVQRTISCGSCNLPATCGGGGTPGVCGCTPVSDAEFCASQGRTCGQATGTDNCGASRNVNCGGCPIGENCTSAGQCQPPCGPANCANGCCNGTVCMPGTTTSACGTGGGACGQCSGIHVCRADQRCGVDPSSAWRVQPVSATVDAVNGSGGVWDSWDNSPPDVFAESFCPPAATAVATNTPQVSSLTPTWSTGGCVTTAGALLTEPYVFQLFDADPFGFRDNVSARISHQVTEADLAAGSRTFPRSHAASNIRVQFIRQ
ncbi:MAG: hypothetical protein ACK4N5_00930 [Myxococcales bacterium]